ncbi:MAG: DUF2270 domain-containing protein [Pseudomonadota bacterium]
MSEIPSETDATVAGVPVTVLVHYYRGELSRVMSWRDRLDRTTNWAIGALAAMLSISLASEEAHHSVLLFAMVLIHVLLFIEARRYRFYHVYRGRLRLIERECLAGIFAPSLGGRHSDLASLGQDLREPRFTITVLQAMSRRLRRNYAWIFLVVLLAWLVKTTSEVADGRSRLVHTMNEFLVNTAVAGISGKAVVVGIALLYAWLIFVMVRFNVDEANLGPGQVHV